MVSDGEGFPSSETFPADSQSLVFYTSSLFYGLCITMVLPSLLIIRSIQNNLLDRHMYACGCNQL